MSFMTPNVRHRDDGVVKQNSPSLSLVVFNAYKNLHFMIR